MPHWCALPYARSTVSPCTSSQHSRPAPSISIRRRIVHATLTRFVPHSAVLDRAVCVVTHGGMGITQKALSRGIPVCAVPFGRDQFEVARRVEIAGAGTRLPARRLTVGRLRHKVLSAMTMTTGADAVAAGFAATGGMRHGADLVERHLGMPTPLHRWGEAAGGQLETLRSAELEQRVDASELLGQPELPERGEHVWKNSPRPLGIGTSCTARSPGTVWTRSAS